MLVFSVSVIIPTYNRPIITAKAVRSALAQDGVNLEVIVVDDCSETPISLDDDLANDARVHLIRRAQNGGAAAARMTGITSARFDIIAFLDSDDIFLPGKLVTQVALLDPAKPLDVVVSGFRYLQTDSRRRRDRYPVPAATIEQFASGCWFCPGSTAVVWKAAFDIVGPLDDQLRRLEDLEWFMRLSLAGGSIVSADIIGSAILVGANGNPAAVEESSARIIQSFIHGSGGPRLTPHVARRLKSYLALEQAAAHRKFGNPVRAIAAGLRSLMLAPRFTIHLGNWWRQGPPRAQ
jgi:glycosyltransferase involved in cell wall biosynthesis